MRQFFGAILILIGLLGLLFRDRLASFQANMHKGIGTVLPWVYRNPVGRPFASERGQRGLVVLASLIFLLGGLFFVLGFVGSD